MATALTLYATGTNLEATGTNGYIGELETSSTSTNATGAASGYAHSTSTPSGWFSLPLEANASGAGTTDAVLGSEPAFGKGSSATLPNGTAYNGLTGKQIVAGTWTFAGELVGSAGATWTVAELHFRVGTRKGSTFTQYGSDITVGVTTITTTGKTFSASGTLPAITFPTATTWLYIDAPFAGGAGTGAGGRPLYVLLGTTRLSIATPGYQTPKVTGTAAFAASGVFGASPSYVGTANFAAVGTFGAFTPRATFTATAAFAGAGSAWLPSLTGMPGTSIQLALTGTAWAGSNWVTIGPLCTGFTTTRGRQHQLQRVEPGAFTLSLSNRDGRFNPWSKNSPYYNQLPPTDSNPTTGLGTWTATSTAPVGHSGLLGLGLLGDAPLGFGGVTAGRGTITRSLTAARYGPYSWALTATTAGTMTVTTDSTTSAVPGRTYVGIVYVQAKTTARSVKVALVWKNATGVVLSTTTGQASDDSTSSLATQWQVRGAAPSGAASKELRVSVLTAASGEVHFFACAGIFDVTYATGLVAVEQGWCVGQQKPLWPGQPIRCVATWHGQQYPIFAGCMSSWVPKYGLVAGDISVTANDYMHLMANMAVPGSSFPSLIASSAPTLLWRLNTATGTTRALDSSGDLHTGTVSASGVTFGSTALVPHTTASSVSIALAYSTSAGSISAALEQPTAWTVELVVDFSATNDQPTLEGTQMKVRVFSWGTGATRLSLYAVQSKAGANELGVVKGTGTVTATSPKVTTIPAGARHVIVTHAATGLTALTSSGFGSSQTLSITTRNPTFTIGGASSTYITGTLKISDVAIYDSVLTSTAITAHNTAYTTGFADQHSGTQIKSLLLAAGVPSSALGTVQTGTVQCQPPLITTGQTQLLSVLQTTDNTEQGLLFCAPTGAIDFHSRAYIDTSTTTTTPRAVIANDATPNHYPPAVPPVPALDDQTLFNYVAVGIQGASATSTSSTQIATTAASAARYGSRMLTGFTGMYFTSSATALVLAKLLISRLAEPLTRVRSIQLSSTTNRGGNLVQMLGRRLLDAVEVIWQPTDGSASPFTQTAQIEQIVHTVTKTEWKTTFVLALPL